MGQLARSSERGPRVTDDEIDAMSRFDSDSNALAWARRGVQHEIDWCDRMLQEEHSDEMIACVRFHRTRLANALIGGEGCVIAAFDHRRSACQVWVGNSQELASEMARMQIRAGSLASAAYEIYRRGHREGCDSLHRDQKCSCDYQLACSILLVFPMSADTPVDIR